MVQKKNIVHSYFKKVIDGHKILVQLNPETFEGLELLVHSNGTIKKTKRSFDEEIYEGLKIDGFDESSPLEFNLYLKGIKGEE